MMSKPLLNTLGLPEAFVRAAQAMAGDYDNQESYLTASSADDPPQIRILMQKHGDEIPPEDASERVWAVGGSAMHEVLRRAARPDDIVERRFADEICGVKVSAQIDLYEPDTGTLSQWKETSAWTLVFKDRLPGWERQLAVETEMMDRHGYEVRAVQVVARLRDWSKNDALRSQDYPKTPIVVVPLRLWSSEERIAYIEARVALNKAADAGNVPPCTDAERWAKPAKYAVMKQGRKSALKLFDDWDDANTMLPVLKGDYVMTRPGDYARCSGGYCRAASVCEQWATDRAAMEADNGGR